MKDINFDDLVPNKPVANELSFDDLVPQQTGFTADMRKRGAELANIIQNVDNQNLGSRALQLAGGVGGTVGDVVGAGISAAQAVNPMMNLAKAVIPEQVQQDVSGMIAKPVQAYEQNLQAYNAANPEAGRNLQAIRDLGNLLPMSSGQVRAGLKQAPALGEEAVRGLGRGVRIAKETIIPAKSPIPTADEIRALSTQSYNRAEQLGGNLKPDFTNKVVDTAQSILPKDPYAKIGRGKTVSDEFAEELKQFRDQPMTLANAEALDKNLTEKIAGTYDVNKRGHSAAGKELIKLQDEFREMIEKADESMVIGTKEGFDSYKQGVKLWAASRRMDDIEDIFKRAEMTDNPATSIKTGFRTLAMNPKRMRGYTPEEAKLIENAAKSGVTTDLLRTFGSRLLPIVVGGAGGGLGATAAASAGSIASRGIASSMQAKRGEKVAREISKRVKIPKEVYNLPPEEAKAAIRKLRESK